MEDRNTRLIVAYFEKTIDDDGLAELKEWLESNEENQEVFSDTIQILSVSKGTLFQPVKQQENWERLKAHIAADSTLPETELIANPVLINSISPKPDYYAYRWLVAAFFLLIGGIATLFGYQQLKREPVQPAVYAQLSNPNGKHSRIMLPDSSVIHLGAGSKIRYEKSFSARKREIYLDGEAFFEVTHNQTRPFIVKSGKVSTVVLGTSFNVKAFAAKNKVSVTVSSGKVGVMGAIDGKTRLISYLLPDEQLIIDTKTGESDKSTINADAASGWRDNNFVYYNTSLKDIASSLQRHYGVEFDFATAELSHIKLTAKFNNLSLQEVTDNLSQLSGLSFQKQGKQIFISPFNGKRRTGMR